MPNLILDAVVTVAGSVTITVLGDVDEVMYVTVVVVDGVVVTTVVTGSCVVSDDNDTLVWFEIVVRVVGIVEACSLV
jgi:hypothetical protein